MKGIKGTFHAKMDTIKERKDMNLREAQNIRERWQEYTEELNKKVLMTWITTQKGLGQDAKSQRGRGDSPGTSAGLWLE